MPDIAGPELPVEALQAPLVAATQLARVNEAAFPEQPDPNLIERCPGPGTQAGLPCEQLADSRGLPGRPGGMTDREPGSPG